MLYSGCQVKIGGKEYFTCQGCENNGYENCDAGKCPQSTIYNNLTYSCQAFQLDLGGHTGLNCASCLSNGVGRCDPNGCPGVTHYDNNTQTCEEDPIDTQCNIAVKSSITPQILRVCYICQVLLLFTYQ